ncbi:MAG: ABC transporter permease [Actinomycetota bacterium]|nr:MAG: Polyamine ABC transporter permease [Acidimicrobiaceae bacterium]
MTTAVADRARRTRAWAGLAMPGVGWLIAFFVVPVYAVLAVAFGQIDPILRTPQPAWSPVDWDFAAMGKVLDRVFGGDLGRVFIRTFSFVALALIGCILIGYPVAYFVARRAQRSRGLLLAALVLPFWISYLMRMLAWTNLLQVDGYVNRVLGWLHLMDTPRNWLDGDWPTVVIGLVYGYVPFFILPLYSALERIDGRLIEAGRDLGASAFSTFMRITLPLSVPGLMAASVITILPMCGDYYTNTYLTSGSPRTEMVGNQIEFYLRGSSQPQTGASLVLLLMALLFVLMVYYLVTTIRQQKAAER